MGFLGARHFDDCAGDMLQYRHGPLRSAHGVEGIVRRRGRIPPRRLRACQFGVAFCARMDRRPGEQAETFGRVPSFTRSLRAAAPVGLGLWATLVVYDCVYV